MIIQGKFKLCFVFRNLQQTYGIELVDDGGKPNKQYLLINCLNYQNHISHSADTEKELALLAIILSLIFMQTNGRWKDAGVEQGERAIKAIRQSGNKL